MKTPKVSVIMPAYNVEKYIEEAIESILGQSFKDYEFVILNDGSTDNTAEIIQKYANKDNRIKFINNKKNKGFIDSLNECLDVAQGEYIAKMDSDDISLPMRLEKQVMYLDTHPDVGLVGVGFKTFGETDTEVIHPEVVGLADFLRNCCTTIFMLRKEIIDKNNIRFSPDCLYVEDYDFYVRFIRFSAIHNLQEILYLYRWHGNNISITQSKVQLENANKIRKNILNFLSNSQDIQKKIDLVINPPPIKVSKTKYYLFGFIPFLKIKQNGNKAKYYLFDVVPLLRKKIKDKL